MVAPSDLHLDFLQKDYGLIEKGQLELLILYLDVDFERGDPAFAVGWSLLCLPL